MPTAAELQALRNQQTAFNTQRKAASLAQQQLANDRYDARRAADPINQGISSFGRTVYNLGFTPNQNFLNSLTGRGGTGSPFDYDKAKAEQKEIFDSILGDVNASRSAREATINEDFETMGRNALANLADRGLSSSNLAYTAQLGNERGKQRALNELEASLLGQSAQTKAGFAGNVLGLQQGEQATARAAQMRQLEILQQLYGGAMGGPSVIQF